MLQPAGAIAKRVCKFRLWRLAYRYPTWVPFLVIGWGFESLAEWSIRKWRGGSGLKIWLENCQFQLLKKYLAGQGVADWEDEELELPITTAAVTY
jgi:hypothetical protein